MIKYFVNTNQKTIEIDKPEKGSWINISPPLRQEEFTELADKLERLAHFLKGEQKEVTIKLSISADTPEGAGLRDEQNDEAL